MNQPEPAKLFILIDLTSSSFESFSCSSEMMRDAAEKSSQAFLMTIRS